jgi:LAO/AO transport system kinase
MPLTGDVDRLAEAAFDGDRRAVARLITVVEEGRPGAARALGLAYPRSGRAYRIGLTGAPGAGKSTLTDGLISALRRRGDRVAVLAVDPTSPFSGGAVLGDRVRMQDHASDPGVFIRSMASRGHLGGLSAAAPKGLTLLDAAGFPFVLIETVGVGQDEVEVADAADTTVVVLTPGWGDGVQAAKAGILEIGDVFVVNKADRPGVDDAVADLRTMLAMGGERPWAPPILTTVASRGGGVAELLDAIEAHRAHLEVGGRLEEGRRGRRRGELRAALAAVLARRAAEAAAAPEHRRVASLVEQGQLDPWTAAERLLGEVASP